MNDLSTIFAGLRRYHVATEQQPFPSHPERGITWVWAANGIFKQGTNEHMSIRVRVGDAPQVPGLAALLPNFLWRAAPARRIPGALLTPILQHARDVFSNRGSVLLPAEQQYFVLWHGNQYRWWAPPQETTATRISYRLPDSFAPLLDLHSHHGMPAYFSATDDADDSGLSISAVIGNIFVKPTIVCRLNVYGHRQVVPARTIFDNLGVFEEKDHATTD